MVLLTMVPRNSDIQPLEHETVYLVIYIQSLEHEKVYLVVYIQSLEHETGNGIPDTWQHILVPPVYRVHHTISPVVFSSMEVAFHGSEV